MNNGVNDLRVKAPTLDAAGHIEKFNIAMLPYNVSRLVSEPEDNSSPYRGAPSPKSSKSSVTATPRSSPLAFKMGKNQNSKSFEASPTPYHFTDVDTAELQPKKSSNLFSMLMSKRTPAAKRSHIQRPSAAYIGVALEDNIAFTAVDVNGDKIVVPTILDQCWREVRKRGLEVEGIFRINGGEREVASICEEFETSPMIKHDFTAMNIHTLPSVIKKYLGALPEPVIPIQFSTVFMEVVDLNTSDYTKVEALIELGSLMSFPHLHLLVYLLDVVINDILSYSDKNLITVEALAVLLYPSCSGQETLFIAAAARKPANRRNFHGVFQGSKADDCDTMLNAAARNGARCMQMWEFLMDHRHALTDGWRKNIRRAFAPQRQSKDISGFSNEQKLMDDIRTFDDARNAEKNDRDSPLSDYSLSTLSVSDNPTRHGSNSENPQQLLPAFSDENTKRLYPAHSQSKQEEQKQLKLKASLSTPTVSSSQLDNNGPPKKRFFARLRTTSMNSRNGVPPLPNQPTLSENGSDDAVHQAKSRPNLKPPSFRARAAEKVIKRRSADLSNKKMLDNEKTSRSDWMKKTYKVAFNRQANE
ncbi:GTPase activating protein (GAP) for Rho1p [Umbelopsis sp. WA50703]